MLPVFLFVTACSGFQVRALKYKPRDMIPSRSQVDTVKFQNGNYEILSSRVWSVKTLQGVVSENASRCVTNMVDTIYFLRREWKLIYEFVSSVTHFFEGKVPVVLHWSGLRIIIKIQVWKRHIVEYLILIGKFNPSHIE